MNPHDARTILDSFRFDWKGMTDDDIVRLATALGPSSHARIARTTESLGAAARAMATASRRLVRAFSDFRRDIGSLRISLSTGDPRAARRKAKPGPRQSP